MIKFTIDSCTGGLIDRPYNSIKDAKRLVLETARKKILKDKCKIVSENEFYKELYSLPLKEQETHIKFIREQLNFYDDL